MRPPTLLDRLWFRLLDLWWRWRTPRCQHPGCRQPARDLAVPAPDYSGWVESADHYCWEHAAEHGYCASCGCLDIDMDPFALPGHCSECSDLIVADHEPHYYSEDPRP